MNFNVGAARALTRRGKKRRERQTAREARKAIRITERRIRRAANQGNTSTAIPDGLSKDAKEQVVQHFLNLGYRVYDRKNGAFVLGTEVYWSELGS